MLQLADRRVVFYLRRDTIALGIGSAIGAIGNSRSDRRLRIHPGTPTPENTCVPHRDREASFLGPRLRLERSPADVKVAAWGGGVPADRGGSLRHHCRMSSPPEGYTSVRPLRSFRVLGRGTDVVRACSGRARSGVFTVTGSGLFSTSAAATKHTIARIAEYSRQYRSGRGCGRGTNSRAAQRFSIVRSLARAPPDGKPLSCSPSRKSKRSIGTCCG